jgi:quercetin dioxygenase-like cupin family protein
MKIALPASVAGAGLLLAACAFQIAAAEEPSAAPPQPRILLSAPLPDAPGKSLVVVPLSFGDKPAQPHRHPGSVYVYVTEGSARLGIEGQPVQTVEAGGSFFEPAGALHTVAQSAVPGKPARAIAVMIVPDGAPLVTPERHH